MALELKETVTSISGCRGFTFTDTTGAYAVNNTGGYGTPNPNNSTINLGVIKVYPPKATVPYIFEFVVETNNIASATLTAPDGTETNILADVSGMSYPFDDTSENVFSILETYFGFEDDTSVTDGVWTFYYENSFEDNSSANTTTYILSSCNACCCITKAFANLKDCGCDGDPLKTAVHADAMYHAATSAANLGMFDQAQANIDKANEICLKNCSTC